MPVFAAVVFLGRAFLGCDDAATVPTLAAMLLPLLMVLLFLELELICAFAAIMPLLLMVVLLFLEWELIFAFAATMPLLLVGVRRQASVVR